MLVHKCDRCGTIYEEPNPLLEGGFKYELRQKIGFTTIDCDLCHSCVEGLYNFLREEEHFRAEEERREKRMEADLGAESLFNKLIGRK